MSCDVLDLRLKCFAIDKFERLLTSSVLSFWSYCRTHGLPSVLAEHSIKMQTAPEDEVLSVFHPNLMNSPEFYSQPGPDLPIG